MFDLISQEIVFWWFQNLRQNKYYFRYIMKFITFISYNYIKLQVKAYMNSKMVRVYIGKNAFIRVGFKCSFNFGL